MKFLEKRYGLRFTKGFPNILAGLQIVLGLLFVLFLLTWMQSRDDESNSLVDTGRGAFIYRIRIAP